MALPKIDIPTYELTLPSVDQQVKYRPFLVKEEKLLMMALESGEDADMKNATIDLVNSCTFGKIKAEELPLFDIEYLFLNIRAKSVGEVAKFQVICPDDKITLVPVDIDLTEVNVQVDDKHNNNILLDESRNLGIVMRYPTLKLVPMGIDKNMNADKIFNLMVSCIDHIYEGDKVYPAKDSSKSELVEFFNNLNSAQFQLIKTFFDEMPKLRHTIKVTNPKTKKESEITFSGLQDFFVSASPTNP
jgi:hypothetical protein|tara:strand:- start:1416 stop:2150 length:735 start_codon:yes stop_codon:yes gene_type:complete